MLNLQRWIKRTRFVLIAKLFFDPPGGIVIGANLDQF